MTPIRKTKIKGKMAQEVIDLLIKKNLISEEKWQEIQQESEEEKRSPLELIKIKELVKEEDIVKAKGEVFDVPYVDLAGKVISGDILRVIPEDLASNYKMVPFNKTERGELEVGLVNPNDFKALEAIEFMARENRYKLKYYIISESSLKYILRQYSTLTAEVEEALKGTEAGVREEAPKIEIVEKGMEEVIKTAPVSKMVSVILRHAVEGNASDVHVEPVGNESRVRYRIDGVLHTSIVLPRKVHASIVARIKVLSNLKIDETRIPQDGRFRMNIEGRDVDYRVSTLPLINDEKVVMRILDTSLGIFKLDQLGFTGRGLEIMKNNIKKSHGMFLITGPTGSGKSTTLYAIIKILNTEGVNIITLEDPVEYYMEGINQSQINPAVGLTFAAGLRSILRQDPDIIMVGEIRDNETAELAVHAALTGHIVLSTLHTNDAFGAVPRLIDMKIEPFLVASSVNIVIAQRLVRKICPYCREEIDIPKNLEEEVRKELTFIPKESMPADVKEMIEKSSLKFYRGKGCARCQNMGYKGRNAIAEVLEVTEDLQKIIVAGSDVDEIKEEFKKQRMMFMKQDGLIKALRGVTTVEEVIRTTRD